MKIKSMCLLVVSLMFAFSVQAADEDVTTICLDGDDISQQGLLSTIHIPRWLDRDRTQGCELALLENIGPIYPARALTEEVEGWAKVSFTVTKEGLVIDAQVIDAEPKGIFDSSAIRAAEFFHFEPRVMNGQAVVVEDVRHVFNFNM